MKVSSVKFNGNSSGESSADTCRRKDGGTEGRTNGRMDMTKVIRVIWSFRRELDEIGAFLDIMQRTVVFLTDVSEQGIGPIFKVNNS